MRGSTKQEDLMIRYLLGELSEEERTRIEELFFTDDQFFEQLMAVEDALTDEYALGNLRPAEREQFRQAMQASPSTMREVEFVRGLIDDLSSRRPSKAGQASAEHSGKASEILRPRAFWQGQLQGRRSLLIAALLIAALAVPVFVWALVLNDRVKRIEAQRSLLVEKQQQLQEQISEQGATNEELAKELEAERGRREQVEQELDALKQRPAEKPAVEVASLVLDEGLNLRGGGEVSTVEIRPGMRRLRIRIELEKEELRKKYRAVIKRLDGREVWASKELRPNVSGPGTVTMSLPTSTLADDDYILTLTGEGDGGERDDVRDYPFRVRRR